MNFYKEQLDNRMATCEHKVFFKSNFCPVCLWSGNNEFVGSWCKHVVADNHHAHVACVHNAQGVHIGEGFLVVFWQLLDVGNDIFGGNFCHLFRRVACFRNAARHLGLFGRLNLNGGTDYIDFGILLVPIIVAHFDKAHFIAETGCIPNTLRSLEAWNRNRENRRNFFARVQHNAIWLEGLHRHIETAIDVVELEKLLTHLLRIAKPTDAKVCRIRLGSDVSERRLFTKMMLG